MPTPTGMASITRLNISLHDSDKFSFAAQNRKRHTDEVAAAPSRAKRAQKRYQVWSRRDVASDPWQNIGSPVLGTDRLDAIH